MNKPNWTQVGDKLAHCTHENHTLLTRLDGKNQTFEAWRDGTNIVRKLELPVFEFSLDVANTLWLLYCQHERVELALNGGEE